MRKIIIIEDDIPSGGGNSGCLLAVLQGFAVLLGLGLFAALMFHFGFLTVIRYAIMLALLVVIVRIVISSEFHIPTMLVGFGTGLVGYFLLSYHNFGVALFAAVTGMLVYLEFF